jgi:hypothetical protein
VKLFYARDFRALMVKYGRLDFLTDITAANGAYAHTGAGTPKVAHAAAHASASGGR